MNHAQYLFRTLIVGIPFLVALSAKAAGLPDPSVELLYGLKESMVKVGTTTKSGGHGFGTGVAVTP